MKKTFLFLVTIFIINTTSAQEQVKNYFNIAKATIKESGQIDKNKYPIGEWNYYLENGAIDYTIDWEINFLTKYYITGEIKETGTFIPNTGVHVGEWITYYKNGEINTKIMYDEKGDLISDTKKK